MKKNSKIINFKKKAIVGSMVLLMVIFIISIIIVATIENKTENETASRKLEKAQAITINARTPNENNYTSVTSEDGIQVPVPKGYVASTDLEERYVNGVTTNGVREHHGGFVIYERLASDEGKTDEQVQQVIEDDLDTAQRTRNQWVWVPISSSELSNMYHVSSGQINGNYYTFNKSSAPTLTKTGERELQLIYDADLDHTYLKKYLEGTSRSEFLQKMREEFYEMLVSVKTYGGYYIGRYETGNTQKNNLRVVKGFTGTKSSGSANNRINYITWYDAYKRIKGMRGTSPVHTNLIFGIQWDETLKWLIDSGEKTYAELGSNSTSWGNYINGSFTYTQTSGVTADGLGTVAGGTATKNSSYYTVIPTGATERNKANNIYDLAGNMGEWTIEFYNNNGYQSRQIRGGEWDSQDYEAMASYRSFGSPYYDSARYGCRAALYIS